MWHMLCAHTEMFDEGRVIAINITYANIYPFDGSLPARHHVARSTSYNDDAYNKIVIFPMHNIYALFVQ